jgi:hypothetical protein
MRRSRRLQFLLRDQIGSRILKSATKTCRALYRDVERLLIRHAISTLPTSLK